MKIFARIAAAVTAAFVSVFVAAPAFAHDEVEKYNPADAFSGAGQPADVIAILVTGAIVLAVVLLLAQGLGGLFDKKAD